MQEKILDKKLTEYTKLAEFTNWANHAGENSQNSRQQK